MSTKEDFEHNKTANRIALMVYQLWGLFGQAKDNFGRATGLTRFQEQLASTKSITGDFIPAVPVKSFFGRRLYGRIKDLFERPICSPPGAKIDILPRKLDEENKYLITEEKYTVREEQEKFKKNGEITTNLNLGSYNYLGFADNWVETCSEQVLPCLDEFGLVSTGTCLEGGYTSVHKELEEFVAKFLHKEAAIVFNMGYGTNSTVLSTLLDGESVVLSDRLNHTSIVNGCRGAEAVKIVPFVHNSMKDLEKKLQQLILCGRSYPQLPSEEHKPWKKMVVVVEGIYSMEGETCLLPETVALCKKYKSYLYVDEAHSIGALGATGRGICEHQNVPFEDVDVLMGTFSKSFAGMGGYVAGSKEMIDKLRVNSPGMTIMSPLSTLVAQQVLTVFKLIDQPDGIGQQKIKALKENSNYFRKKLAQIGCLVLGDEDSPVIPVMIYNPSKGFAFSHELLKRGIAVVIVGFPATPLGEIRARFCLSAAHSKEDLREAIKQIAKVSKLVGSRYGDHFFG